MEARTIVTLPGDFRERILGEIELASADVPSLSPRSCYIHRSNCVGFLSPLFSADTLLEFSLLKGGSALYKFSFEGVIGVISRWF